MPPIPYVRQAGPDACGAACLAMVYHSLGLGADQADILCAVSRPGAAGASRCYTHLLCQDALARGLDCVIVQARPPWGALRACLDASLRVVINHRMKRSGRRGHFSVLLGVDDHRAALHDPLVGPERHLGREELLALWSSSGEVAGHVLLALSPRRPAAACGACGAVPAEEIDCPLCRKQVSLRPGEALGCGTRGCAGRRWAAVFCPWCDFRIDESGGGEWRLTPNRSWQSWPRPMRP